jgi:hypothetical protein
MRKLPWESVRKSGGIRLFLNFYRAERIMEIASVTLAEDNILDESFLTKAQDSAFRAGAALKSALTKVLGLFDAKEGDRRPKFRANWN